MKLILFTLLMFLTSFLVAQTDPDVENYNYVLGTQTIGPKYKFTNDDALVETAKAIYNMGSKALKISLNVSSYTGVSGSYSNLTSLIRDNSSFRYVTDMPFRDYFFWARSHANWADGYSESERNEDSVQIYNLTKYLLMQYNNSGKTFYLGHWEGDWYLLPNYDRNYVPSDERCQNMAKWYRTRQNAVDKAKADSQFSGVNVYHYAEVNQVVDAKFNNKKRVVNCVLPLTNVDFVSYSSYDAQWYDQNKYNSVLDYIQSFLTPKPNLNGKRVFIGEVGNSLEKSGWDINKHESDNRAFFRTALAWGSPFVLYWEMYNNELDANNNNRHRGFWLINDKQEKQPLYYTFTYFYSAAKQYVTNYKLINKTLPNNLEYAAWTANYLSTKPTPTGVENPIYTGIQLRKENDNLFVENHHLDAEISLYALNGIKIQTFSLLSGEHKTLVLPKGIYLVSIQQKNQISTQKIIL